MRRHAKTPLFALCCYAATSLLVACGGGGGASGVLPVGQPISAAATPTSSIVTTLRLVVPTASSGSASKRKRFFVSASTQAALVSATLGSGVPVSTTVDLSPNSSACTNQSAGRVCAVALTVPFGAVTFSVSTYDLAPVNGAIPSGAHVLGRGSVTQTIATQTPNVVTIAIDAMISGYGNIPSFVSLPGDRAAHTLGFALNPTDFGNNAIVNGAADPYSNPITVALAESGGVGHAQLVLNGSLSGTTATLTKSTDALAVAYDGAGAPGYSIGVGFSATGVGTFSTTVSPLYVTSASGLYVAPNLSLTGVASMALFSVNEAQVPASTLFTATPSNCTAAATVSGIAPVGGVATFSISGLGSSGTCLVIVSDGTSGVTVAVSNSVPTPAPPTAPPTAPPSAPPTLAPTATPGTPPPLVSSVYVDGNGSSYETFPIASVIAASPNPYNVAAATTFTPTAGFSAYFTVDAAHNMLWTSNGAVYGYPASSVGTVSATKILTPTIGSAFGSAVDTAGNVYVSVYAFPTQYIEVFAAGSTTPSTVATTTLQNAGSMKVDGSGNIYVVDRLAHTFNVLAPIGTNAGAVTATVTRTISAGLTTPYDVALDSSGRAYVVDPLAFAVYVFAAGTTNASQSTPIETIAGGGVFPSTPQGIAIDANNYVYVSDTNSIVILSPNSITASLGGTLNYPSQGTIWGANTLLSNAVGIAAH